LIVSRLGRESHPLRQIINELRVNPGSPPAGGDFITGVENDFFDTFFTLIDRDPDELGLIPDSTNPCWRLSVSGSFLGVFAKTNPGKSLLGNHAKAVMVPPHSWKNP
jgi:hypothetical protein